MYAFCFVCGQNAYMNQEEKGTAACVNPPYCNESTVRWDPSLGDHRNCIQGGHNEIKPKITFNRSLK